MGGSAAQAGERGAADPRKTTMPSSRRMAATFETVTMVCSMLPWRTPR